MRFRLVVEKLEGCWTEITAAATELASAQHSAATAVAAAISTAPAAACTRANGAEAARGVTGGAVVAAAQRAYIACDAAGEVVRLVATCNGYVVQN